MALDQAKLGDWTESGWSVYTPLPMHNGIRIYACNYDCQLLHAHYKAEILAKLASVLRAWCFSVSVYSVIGIYPLCPQCTVMQVAGQCGERMRTLK